MRDYTVRALPCIRCKRRLCNSLGNLELEEIGDDLDLELDQDGEDILDEHPEDRENSGQGRTDEA